MAVSPLADCQLAYYKNSMKPKNQKTKQNIVEIVKNKAQTEVFMKLSKETVSLLQPSIEKDTLKSSTNWKNIDGTPLKYIPRNEAGDLLNSSLSMRTCNGMGEQLLQKSGERHYINLAVFRVLGLDKGVRFTVGQTLLPTEVSIVVDLLGQYLRYITEYHLTNKKVKLVITY